MATKTQVAVKGKGKKGAETENKASPSSVKAKAMIEGKLKKLKEEAKDSPKRKREEKDGNDEDDEPLKGKKKKAEAVDEGSSPPKKVKTEGKTAVKEEKVVKKKKRETEESDEDDVPLKKVKKETELQKEVKKESDKTESTDNSSPMEVKSESAPVQVESDASTKTENVLSQVKSATASKDLPPSEMKTDILKEEKANIAMEAKSVNVAKEMTSESSIVAKEVKPDTDIKDSEGTDVKSNNVLPVSQFYSGSKEEVKSDIVPGDSAPQETVEGKSSVEESGEKSTGTEDAADSGEVYVSYADFLKSLEKDGGERLGRTDDESRKSGDTEHSQKKRDSHSHSRERRDSHSHSHSRERDSHSKERRDSKEEKYSHHHHHHHSKHEHERRDSKEGGHGHSHTHHTPRRESKDSRERHESVDSKTSSTDTPTSKVVEKKSEKKKPRKSQEVVLDPSMTDLFQPDIITPSKEKEVKSTGTRETRKKSTNFLEILKQEKLGSDDEGDNDDEYEDDETDQTWEEPGKVYCLCRQPYNKKFMICCDKCEEWYHGKCVGITKQRGKEMEKNNEEYICPKCSDKETEKEVTSTGSPEKEKKEETPKKESDTKDTSEDRKSEPRDVVSIFEKLQSDSTTSQNSVASSSSSDTKVEKGKEAEAVKKSTTAGEETKGQIRKRTTSEGDDKKKKRFLHLKEGHHKEKAQEKLKGKDQEKSKEMPKKCIGAICTKNARPGSVYCSNECIVKHAKDALNTLHKSQQKSSPTKTSKEKKPAEKKVVVVERKTGRILSGSTAPTESNLQKWLEEHPTFEVLTPKKGPQPAIFPVESPKEKSESKHTVHKEKTPSKKKEEDKSKEVKEEKKPEGPDPVRLNVRKHIRDVLALRAEEADDVMLSGSEIKGLALTIEGELFRYFKDTGHKYKAKYRSLIFNIKDPKNKGLFRKILSRKIRPQKLVRMSPEELASQELAKWRAAETRHSIEMIELTEQENVKESSHAHITKKTHKGEVEVEAEEDLSSLVETKKEIPIEPGADLLSEIIVDTTEQHGRHLFDLNCKVCTGKMAPPKEEASANVKVSKTVKVKEERKKSETEEVMEKEKQAEEVVKEVLKAIQKAKADQQAEKEAHEKRALQRRLSSSVTVGSPDSALQSGLEKKPKFTPSGPMLWKGFVYMQDVSKFVTTAYRVTGPCQNLDLPDTIHVCGRIDPAHVWDYLGKIKQSGSKDICVVRYIPGGDEEKAAYIHLYSYLNSRSRCGVVGSLSRNIKDFYIIPLASHSKIPSVLKPFDGPGLEENRPHMLIGVIVRQKIGGGDPRVKAKQSSSTSSSTTSEDKDRKSSSKSSSSSSSSHSHHRHHHNVHPSDPRKAAAKHKLSAAKPGKSILKSATSDDKSSTPTSKTSSTSSTPSSASDKTSKSKVKLAHDPIVNKFSDVTEQEEDSPYDPGEEEDDPYDPEQVSVKETTGATSTTEKSDGKTIQPSTMSKMIEKIASSKNPAEATAAMVAALASTTNLADQRKLLLELTQRVDEQKKLLEKKRLEAQSSGQTAAQTGSSASATATVTTVPAGVGPVQPPSDGVLKSTTGIPTMVPPPSVPVSASLTTAPTFQTSAKALESSVSVSQIVPSVLTSSSTLACVPQFFPTSTIATSQDSSTAVAKTDDNSKPSEAISTIVSSTTTSTSVSSVKSTSEIVVASPSVNMSSINQTSSVSSTESSITADNQATVSSLAKTSTSVTTISATSTKTSVTNTSSGPALSDVFTLSDSKPKKTVISFNISKSLGDKTLSSDSKDEKADKADGSKQSDGDESGSASRTIPVASSDTKELPTALQSLFSSIPSGMISGLKIVKDPSVPLTVPKAESKKSADKEEKKSIEKKEDKLEEKVESKIEPEVGIESKPEAVAEKKEKEQNEEKIITETSVEQISPTKKKPQIIYIQKVVKKSKPDDKVGSEKKPDAQASGPVVTPAVAPTSVPKTVTKTSTAEKKAKSKTFLGFDYESDSSEGSFEGFDKDEVETESPRKKLGLVKKTEQPKIPGLDLGGEMKKGPSTHDEKAFASSVSVFGDVDIRIPGHQGFQPLGPDKGDKLDLPEQDLDLRGSVQDLDMRGGQDQDMRKPAAVMDIDERVAKDSPKHPQHLPQGEMPELQDVDHRQLPPVPFPTGTPPLRPMLVPSNQPPPPGEDWQPGQPAPPPLPPPINLPPPPPLPKKPPPGSQDLPSEDSDLRKGSGQEGKEDKKEKKKGKKKSTTLLPSDERLKQIILQIASRPPDPEPIIEEHEPMEDEPMQPPPIPQMGPVMQPPLSKGQGLLPTPPLQGGLLPIPSSAGMMPPPSSVGPPMSSQGFPPFQNVGPHDMPPCDMPPHDLPQSQGGLPPHSLGPQGMPPHSMEPQQGMGIQSQAPLGMMPHSDMPPHGGPPHTDMPSHGGPPLLDRPPHPDMPSHGGPPHPEILPHGGPPHLDMPPHGGPPLLDRPPHPDMPLLGPPQPHRGPPHPDMPPHPDTPQRGMRPPRDVPPHGMHPLHDMSPHSMHPPRDMPPHGMHPQQDMPPHRMHPQQDMPPHDVHPPPQDMPPHVMQPRVPPKKFAPHGMPGPQRPPKAIPSLLDLPAIPPPSDESQGPEDRLGEGEPDRGFREDRPRSGRRSDTRRPEPRWRKDRRFENRVHSPGPPELQPEVPIGGGNAMTDEHSEVDQQAAGDPGTSQPPVLRPSFEPEAKGSSSPGLLPHPPLPPQAKGAEEQQDPDYRHSGPPPLGGPGAEEMDYSADTFDSNMDNEMFGQGRRSHGRGRGRDYRRDDRDYRRDRDYRDRDRNRDRYRNRDRDRDNRDRDNRDRYRRRDDNRRQQHFYEYDY